MATVTIVYWRDIPAQVIVRQGRRTAKVQLSERFEKAIDRAAMRGGARDTDAYLAEWRRGDPEACGGRGGIPRPPPQASGRGPRPRTMTSTDD
jgi:hypothetical protein